MKNIFLFAILFLIINITAFSQTLSFELDKIREIKLLESTREDVRRILTDYKSDEESEDDPGGSETFSSEKIDVKISYTSGDCSDDADDTDEWNVPQGKVKSVEISFNDSVKPEDLDYNISSLKKEQKYANVDDEFVYHDKKSGIAFFVYEDDDEKTIDEIRILPDSKQSSSLCKNEEAEGLKNFYSNDSYFINPKLEDRVLEADVPAYVTELTLSEYEIDVSCSAVDKKRHKNCSNSPRIISVSTTAFDSENDTLVYNYHVTGGRIVGEGKNVIWDLADVKPGKYTITAGVDDGCGICGETKTKEVVVR